MFDDDDNTSDVMMWKPSKSVALPGSFRTTDLLSIKGANVDVRRFLPSTELQYCLDDGKIPELMKYLSMYYKGEIDLGCLIEFQNKCGLEQLKF
jgi:hypothetical protein